MLVAERELASHIPQRYLADVADIVMGQSPPGNTYNDQGIGLPFFQGKAEFGETSPTTVKWCSSPTRIAEAGDILISVRAPVGPTNIAMEKCCIGRGLAAIRPDPSELDRDYLLYFLKYIEPSLSNRGQGSTFSAINKKELHAIKVPIPSLTEQRHIIDILKRADSIRRLRKQAIDTARQLIPALFIDIFGDPVTNPKGWPMLTFGEVCDCRLGKMLDKKRQTGKHLRPYLRNANVQWGRFELSDMLEMDFDEKDRKTFSLRKGDVLICEGGEVGRAAIWNNDLEECYFQKALHRVRPNTEVVTSEYILWLMWALAKSGGLVDSTSRATIAHLTGVKLKSLRIPVPPIERQKNFVALIENVNSILSQQEAAQSGTESSFQSLLHRAFSGGA